MQSKDENSPTARLPINFSLFLQTLFLNAKIRESQLQKVPFTLVVGDKEVEQEAVSPRRYGGEDLKTMKLEAFLALFAKEAALP